MKAQSVVLAAAILLIGGAIVYLQSQKVSAPGNGTNDSTIPITASTMTTEEKAKQYDRAKEISSPDGFINTDTISISGLIGKKVILVDFWTYSCINCQRTTPYLNAWYLKYKDKGLEIIGIHTPEFEFEKKYDNVKKAVTNEHIEYPVVLDNDYSTWHAYGNRYWPRKYLIDIDGFIVYDHIGEGAYEETEQKIQEALAERMRVLGMQGELRKDIVKPEGIETPIAESPETYFGATRNQGLNGSQAAIGELRSLAPDRVARGKLYLAGTWNITGEYAENTSRQSKILFRYKAKNVFFVASADKPVRLRVMIDGKPIGAEAGEDVRNGVATIQDERLYRLIQHITLEEHTLELIVEDPGLKAFTFTFG